MTLPTEVFRYAGVDLRSMGLYMSLVDGMLSTPPVRGSNVLVPYSHGQRWVPKYYDQRHIVLAGEMISVASRIDLQNQVDKLKALFPIGAGEQKLEIQRADGSFRYVMAEVLNTMGLQWQIFPTRSSAYSIELIASDPFWYGSVLEAGVARAAWTFDSGVSFDDGGHWFDTTAVSFAQTLSGSPVNVEATNSGDYYNRKPVFTLNGVLANPKIVNLRNGFSLQVTSAVSPMVIDCGAQLVNGNNAIVTLGAGQTDWMHLESGENTLTITGAAGAAYQAVYSPTYL